MARAEDGKGQMSEVRCQMSEGQEQGTEDLGMIRMDGWMDEFLWKGWLDEFLRDGWMDPFGIG